MGWASPPLVVNLGRYGCSYWQCVLFVTLVIEIFPDQGLNISIEFCKSSANPWLGAGQLGENFEDLEGVLCEEVGWE